MEIISTREPIDYAAALSQMHAMVDEIISGERSNTIWFLEHKPVYTVGYTTYKDFQSQHGDKIGATPLLESERGGKITFHGPGQKICYLMINLRKVYGEIALRRFIDDIHSVIIGTLDKFGVESFQDKKYPGVWVKEEEVLCKIAALGMRIRKGVSYHGFAVNLNTDLQYFKMISPCGITDYGRGVTSLKKHLGKAINQDFFDEILESELKKMFFSENKAIEK